jgi:catechol 2,3-dioxygenase-like lactoylglutathione lyase family enzyme
MSILKVEDIAFVRFRAPDLERMQAFLQDFGLAPVEHAGGRLFMRGCGPAPFVHVSEAGDPGFIGFGLCASSLDDLERLAKSEGAPVEPFVAPGGGFVVRLSDPDGFQIEVVAGQAPAAPLDEHLPAPWNRAGERNRVRTFKRIAAGPAHVIRLGHCVIKVADFRRSERWYKERFGLITSDEVELSPGVPLGAFLRCDRGDVPTDHHTLFLIHHPEGPDFHHAAFEVRDLDDLMGGADYLTAKGHRHEWGVGRHVLGSQVFDYWRDPWGNKIEHWTDGDLLTAGDGSNRASLDQFVGVQWGPSAPPTMA